MSDEAADAGEAPADGGASEAVADGGDSPTTVETSAEPADESGSTSQLADAEVWRYLRLGAIGLLALLALIATFQLYTNTSAAIARWVSPTYVPVFQAAFNLVVLLLSLAGLAVLARRRLAGD